jgi:hypothetical protein
MVIWQWIAGFLVVGYLSMTRSFAYLGIPPLQIFIGEIALAAFLFCKPRVALGTWTLSLLRPSPLNELGLAMLVFMLYGIWQFTRGILAGSSIFHTLKYFIFNYYTIYMFFGMWVGLRVPDFLPKLVRAIAWVNGVYGLIWIVVLRRYDATLLIPGTDVQVFGEPVGSAIAILGLCCVERDFRKVWFLLMLNTVVLLTLQWRIEWLALALGMGLWGIMKGRFGRVVAMGLAGLTVLGMIDLAGIDLAGRNTPVSLDETLARVIAPIDEDLAKELSPHAQMAAHTVEWREKWWNGIWHSSVSSLMLAAFGHGYGFNMLTLAPPEIRYGDVEHRIPHSVFYAALGYTGWVGVVLFGFVQLAIFRLLWRGYRLTRQTIGIVWWVAGMTMCSFEAGFDTPYRAIPLYLMWGMAMAPALRLAKEPDATAADGRAMTGRPQARPRLRRSRPALPFIG